MNAYKYFHSAVNSYNDYKIKIKKMKIEVSKVSLKIKKILDKKHTRKSKS